MSSIKFKKIAQILFLTRLPPFPNGQSFGQVRRTITFVLWLHAWCRFHTTKRSVTFYSDFSILFKPAIAAPKVISLSQETIFQFIPI